MSPRDYWRECLSAAADEAGQAIPDDLLDHLAESCVGAHDNYGMAFYSPPPSDRLNEIEREWRQKCERLEAEFERYRAGAEKAIKRALPRRTFHTRPCPSLKTAKSSGTAAEPLRSVRTRP